MVDVCVDVLSPDTTKKEELEFEEVLVEERSQSSTSQITPFQLVAEEDYSAKPTDENAFNLARLNVYKAKFSEKFLQSIRDSEFEFGYDSLADIFVRERIAENALATKEWINSLFIENYPNNEIAVGILRVIAHLDYDEIAPQGPTMALAALVHVSLEVRECGMRAFENWGTMECLKVLRSISCSEDWLSDYVHQVVKDLEEVLLDVRACKKD